MSNEIAQIIDNSLSLSDLQNLHAIAHFCDVTKDGRMRIIPPDRVKIYEPGGGEHALVETGCIRVLASRPRHIRMTQIGRRVLALAAGRGLNLMGDDEQTAE